jgi:hypothetical protein
MYLGTKLSNHIASSSVRKAQISGHSSPNEGSMQTPTTVESYNWSDIK